VTLICPEKPVAGRILLVSASLLAVCLPASLAAQSIVDQHAAFESASVHLPDNHLSGVDLPDAPSVQAAPAPQSTTPTPPPTPATTPATTAPTSTPDQSSSQPTTPAPDAQPPQSGPITTGSKKQDHDEAERELQVEEKQRLLGVMPQFQVVMGGTAVKLSAGEKMRLALHTAIDPFYIGYAFVISGGYGELVDSHAGFGWGPAGYFKRVGAGYADNVNGAIVGNGILPALLRQDPRYFRKGTGSIKGRFLYAALSTVICHGDNGKNQANVSNVLGNFVSGAISNAYYPANERGVALTLENGAEVTAFGAVGGQILEFGPDLARLLHHKRHPKTVPTPAATPTP